MGRIFSWEEIVSRSVPEIESFDEVQRTLEEKLSIFPFIGGIICGSVLQGRHNVRSDLDCLLLYTSDQTELALSIKQKLISYARKLNVPLELISIDTRTANSLCHQFGPSFAQHVEWSAKHGGIIRGNILPRFAVTNDLKQGFIEYLRRKIRVLEKYLDELLILDTKERCKFLQKVLEAPIYVVRDFLVWQGEDLGGTSKAIILEKVSNKSWQSFLRKISDLDHLYSDELHQQLKNPNHGCYSAVINEIEEVAPEVLGFVKAVAWTL